MNTKEKFKFSPREGKIIKIIGAKKMTYGEISAELFKDVRGFDSNIVVGNCVLKIIKKCSYHDLKWTLEKTKTPGELLTIKKVGRL